MLTFLQLGRYGRVCNQMFQIASTIGIATRHGYQYGFPRWVNWDHVERFKATEDIDIQKYFLNPLPGIPYPHDPTPGGGGSVFRNWEVPWGYHDVRVPNEHISFAGHMQSEKYFEHCKDLIRVYFTFDKDKLAIPAYNWLMFPEAICGIHVRRGDYDNDYHPFTPLDYYERAMADFPEGTTFIVFSDSPDKAKELFANSQHNFVFVEGNHTMVDLYLMTQCKHFITCNSSYSWWGAWLIENPDKRIYIPLNWFGASAGGINGADLICPNWKAI